LKELKLIIDLHKPHTSGNPIKETAMLQTAINYTPLVNLR
jgi:hypothetical protein